MKRMLIILAAIFAVSTLTMSPALAGGSGPAGSPCTVGGQPGIYDGSGNCTLPGDATKTGPAKPTLVDKASIHSSAPKITKHHHVRRPATLPHTGPIPIGKTIGLGLTAIAFGLGLTRLGRPVLR
ncbi:MAG: hypothetical protein ABIS59_02590 [Candidatus Saccharibacteria bacterium]